MKFSTHKRNKPFLLGITGGFGTGKSFAGSILRGKDIFVIDTDAIVAKILNTKNPSSGKIISEFGQSIINVKNKNIIDKKILSRIVFKDKVKLEKLESILHPEVKKQIKSLVLKHKNKKIIAVLIPLLFEAKMQKDYDEIWCVTCRKNIQVKRLLKKGYRLNDIKERLNAQLPQNLKVKLSDYVINNSGTKLNTKKQITRRIKSLAL